MTKPRVYLENASRLGFGGYRLTKYEREHREALIYAITRGCTLIDTACNYMDGQSEELIGEVLSEGRAAFVITKIGYISPATFAHLQQTAIDTTALQSISSESMYSLDVDIVRAQLKLSARRLRRSCLDAVLLHNPEHQFENAIPAFSKIEYQAQLKRLFEMLEEQVARGNIQCYGVSSNSLVMDWLPEIRLLLGAAKSVSSSPHFKIVEVPCNLLERQACTATPQGTLIEFLKDHGVVSVGHRLLNARYEGQNYRLAVYEPKAGMEPSGSEALANCCELINEQLKKVAPDQQIMDFSVMKFLRDNWNGIEHPDLVDQILEKHFLPFLNHLWHQSTPSHVQQAYQKLRNAMRFYARQHISWNALQIKKQLESTGEITVEENMSLSRAACEFGLNVGFNHVVVGMRSKAYVDDLAPLIGATN